MKKFTNIVRRKTFNNFSITLEISSDHSSTSVLSKIKIIQVQCFFDTWRFDADFSDRSADWTPRTEVRGRLYPDHRGGQLLSPRLLQILHHIGCRSRCKPQNSKNSSFHYKEKKQWMYSKWVNKELFFLYKLSCSYRSDFWVFFI